MRSAHLAADRYGFLVRDRTAHFATDRNESSLTDKTRVRGNFRGWDIICVALNVRHVWAKSKFQQKQFLLVRHLCGEDVADFSSRLLATARLRARALPSQGILGRGGGRQGTGFRLHLARVAVLRRLRFTKLTRSQHAMILTHTIPSTFLIIQIQSNIIAYYINALLNSQKQREGGSWHSERREREREMPKKK